jgi:transglutaminase-like putative cysteine protease
MARRVRASDAVRDSVVVLRVVAFAALTAFAAIHWVALLGDPPLGRVALTVAAQVVAAAAIAAIAAARLPRLVSWALALAVAVVAIAAGALAIGMPLYLLAPGHWGELVSGLNGGLSQLGGADLPYDGGGWPRLAVLLGLPLCLGLAAALAFWPARRAASVLRTLALVILVAVYGIGATVTPPGAPIVHGLALLLLIAAWLWLPGLGRREALLGGALVLAAGAIALPAAAGLDRGHPWLDYRDWDWAWYEAGGGESFLWNHSYGPIDWPRQGRTMLEVRSDEPHYWRAEVLDQFNGTGWVQSGEGNSGNVELPLQPSTGGVSFSPQTVRLNPDWISEMDFSVRGLSSPLVVGAGTALSVDGLGGVTHTGASLTLAAERPLAEGDAYTVRAYVPDPSPGQMRNSPRRYPSALAPYAMLAIPRSRILHKRGLGPPPRRPSSTIQLTTAELSVPWWGSGGPAHRRTAQVLSRSPYDNIYRLARRITDGAPSAYAAVNAVEDYLKAKYTYSETPPDRSFPLRAFLFKDRAGYCQQFSGAMALMLRLVGIPSRVATGFGPGRPNGEDGAYVVRDFDAHSWVEVYFNRIGWVPFDPTPSAAPADSQTNGLGLFGDVSNRGGKVAEKSGRTPAARENRPGSAHASPKETFSPSLVPLYVFGLAAVVGAAVLGVRIRRARSLSPAGATEARLRELEAALRRVRAQPRGGTTLLALEGRLARFAGPAAAAYAARLRAARYSPRDPGPPTAAERRALRRELSSGRGLRSRFRGFLAIPPGGPLA